MGYKFIKLLGKGSYGSVYLAQQESKVGTDEYVAIKKFYMNDKNSYQSFKNEVKILKKIKSDYLIKILDYYKDSKHMYLVMEYAPMGDLEEYIRSMYQKRTTISNKFVDTVIYQIKEGLNVLHQEKIIHRDIKTSNILIFNNNLVKITDFGVSKILENNNMLAYSNIGTPYYMSPEMINGNPYNFSIDFWALGCVIYKMLTNKYPFDANNMGALICKIKAGRYDLSKIPIKYKKLVSKLIDNKYSRGNDSDIDNFIFSKCNTFINFHKLKLPLDDNDNVSNDIVNKPVINLKKNTEIEPINHKPIEIPKNKYDYPNNIYLNKLKVNLEPVLNNKKNYHNYKPEIKEKEKLIPIINRNDQYKEKLNPIINKNEQYYNQLKQNKGPKIIKHNDRDIPYNYYNKIAPINNNVNHNRYKKNNYIYENNYNLEPIKKKQKNFLPEIKNKIPKKQYNFEGKFNKKNFIEFNIKNIKKLEYQNHNQRYKYLQRVKEIEEEIKIVRNLPKINKNFVKPPFRI